jgi:hypothetical protein
MNSIFRSSFQGGESTLGLWQACGLVLNEKRCYALPCPEKEGVISDSCNKILAARAFVTLACIISGISALCLFLSAVTSETVRRILLIAGKGLAFASLITGIIGVAVGINVTTFKLKWGAAAILGIIAIVINFFGAISSVLIK